MGVKGEVHDAKLNISKEEMAILKSKVTAKRKSRMENPENDMPLLIDGGDDDYDEDEEEEGNELYNNDENFEDINKENSIRVDIEQQYVFENFESMNFMFNYNSINEGPIICPPNIKPSSNN
jgi:hypothetical protein